MYVVLVCLCMLHVQIRLTRHYRERIGSGVFRENDGGKLGLFASSAVSAVSAVTAIAVFTFVAASAAASTAVFGISYGFEFAFRHVADF